MTNILEFPQRWLDAIVAGLAARMIYILPGADMTRAPILEGKAVMAKQLAWDEERPSGPYYLTPMIGGYTQSNGGKY